MIALLLLFKANHKSESRLERKKNKLHLPAEETEQWHPSSEMISFAQVKLGSPGSPRDVSHTAMKAFLVWLGF